MFSSGDLRLAVPVHLEGRTVGSIALRATLDDLYVRLGRMLLIVAVSATMGSYISRRMRLKMAATEGAIKRMALYERVTGRANRHAFELRLSQTLQRHVREGGGSERLFIDVDGFKKVNDLFGHQIGDVVQQAIGERLGKQLRASDIVARIGGDEFAVILTNTSSPGDAARVAGNLVRIAAESFDAGGHRQRRLQHRHLHGAAGWRGRGQRAAQRRFGDVRGEAHRQEYAPLLRREHR